MLEPITEEKLKEYGFDVLMIERLKTWEDYECKVTNGTDFICASNITGIIYTGEHGYDKFHNIGIDRFKTFDSMFDTAYAMETVTIEHKPGLSNSHKAAIYKLERKIYECQFQEWLHKFKGLKRLTDERHYEQYDKQYIEFLTKEVWLEFLIYKKNQIEERLKRDDAEKKSWQITSKEPEAIKAIKNSAAYKLTNSPIYKAFGPGTAFNIAQRKFELMQLPLARQMEQMERLAPEETKPYVSMEKARIEKRASDENNLIDRLIERLEPIIHPVETKPGADQHRGAEPDKTSLQIASTEPEKKEPEAGQPEQTETKPKPQTLTEIKTKIETPSEDPPRPQIRPTFEPESINQIFDILKNYFSIEQQPRLKEILETDNNSSEKIVFKWYGKTLVDFFKQLMIGRFLFIPVKADLEKWIVSNFLYSNRQSHKKFILKGTHKIISGSERAAKGKRLIDVIDKNGKWEITLPKIENRQQQ